MDGEKIILSQNEKKKIEKKVMASIEARPVNLYFIANDQFSHSGSHWFITSRTAL